MGRCKVSVIGTSVLVSTLYFYSHDKSLGVDKKWSVGTNFANCYWFEVKGIMSYKSIPILLLNIQIWNTINTT